MTTPPRALVVELAGPAGAGKSAVLKALAGRDPGIHALRRVREMRHLPLLSKHAIVALAAAPAIMRDAPRDVWTVTRLLARLGALRDVVRQAARRPCKAIVLDEGPLYSMAMLRGRVPDGRLARTCDRALAEWAGALDLIVWLDAPDAVLTERIKSRAKDHVVKDRDASAIAEFLGRHREWLSRTVAVLSTQPGVRMLAFHTDVESADSVAQQVLGALAQAGSHAIAR